MEWRDKAGSWSKKCAHFFCENAEENGDITFLVGEGKEKIKAYKLLLRIASPVFDRGFSADWDNLNAIELPDILPEIFRQFLKVILSDEPVGLLQELNLPLPDLIHLLYIAKKYSVTETCRAIFDILLLQITPKNALFIYENVVAFDDDSIIFGYISTNMKNILMEGEGFKDISKESLTSILRSDFLLIDEMLLFEGVYKWAIAQCQCRKEGLDAVDVDVNVDVTGVTGESVRKALGQILYLIRFPQMTVREIVNVVIPKNILTNEETLHIISYISKTGQEKSIMLSENPNFPFNTQDRQMSSNGSKLQVLKGQRKMLTTAQSMLDPPFVCDGTTKVNLEIMHYDKLLIYSIGFLGPIQGNSSYDIEIGFGILKNQTSASTSTTPCMEIHRKSSKKVFAREGKFFYVVFKKPVELNPKVHSTIRSIISFTLKGADVPRWLPSRFLDESGMGVCFNYNNENPSSPVIQLQYDLV